MATDYSQDYLQGVYGSIRALPIRTVLGLFPLIEMAWRVQRALARPQVSNNDKVPACGVNSTLEASASHFQTHGWTFVENMLHEDFHRYLVDNWPKRCYFTAPFDKYKTYDKGFRWVERNPGNDRWGTLLKPDALTNAAENLPPFVDRHTHVRNLFEFLRSDSFAARMTNFSGRPHALRFNRFQLTTSYPGTFVAPHRDSQQDAKSWLSLIFHIAATGGANSGALAISRDNEFREVIFEPTALANTCVIFDPAAEFFHGVRPIAFGKYRWMVSAEYVSVD